MTAFVQQPQAAAEDEFRSNVPSPAKRPSRWSVSNWSVRRKVFAIVLVPLLLAGTFGGLRVYTGWTQAADLRLATDRAQLVPAIEDYMAALDGALLANSTGGDAQAALTTFDSSKKNLQSRLSNTDAVPDTRKGVTALLQGGQALLDKVTANSIAAARQGHHLRADPADRRGRDQRLGAHRRRAGPRQRRWDCPARSVPAARC